MNIKILGTAFAMVAILLDRSAAKADQITLGPSTVGEFSFTGSTNPPNSITVSVGPAGITGTGYFGSFLDLGTYRLGPTSFTTNSLSGNNFSIDPSNVQNVESFSWSSMGDADAVTGLI